MSTVLTKPVLLDETGQAIVGKLDEIKEAIDNGGTEKYPVLIHITTMPTKTSYIAGEQLNLAGMVVKAVFSNNVEYDVTDQCTFSPANGTVLTSSDTSVIAAYTWHPTGTSFTATQAITVKGIVGISVATPPTKTDYIINETLDLTGMVVHLDYDDNTYEDITSDCTYVPANGATLDDDTLTAVAISYYEPALATTLTTSQAISVIAPIYGVSWDGSASSAMSRTDMAAEFTDPIPQMSDGNGGWTDGSSPFDDILPWSGMKRVEDANGGTLVEIPKFYFKVTTDSNQLRGIQISPVALDGFEISPAHADRGDGQGERNKIYVGAYHTSGNIKSETGQSPSVNQQRTSVRSNIRNKGNDLFLWDFRTLETIWLLYSVEFADWNSQGEIGYGCSDDGAVQNTGLTDPMTYHTGTTKTNKTSFGHTRYRWIEDLWGNVFDWIDGIYVTYQSYAYKVMVMENPLTYADQNGVDSGFFIQSGYSPMSRMNKSAQNGTTWMLWPSNGVPGTSNNSYLCDGQTQTNASGADVAVCTGASYTKTDTVGLFYLYSKNAGDSNIGSRIMKLPANT